MRFQRVVVAAICLLLLMTPWAVNAQSEPTTYKEHGLGRLTAAESKLHSGEKIAFFGDSITMQGGYLQLMEQALKASDHASKLGIQLLPHGLNGGRVPTVLEGKSPWGDLGAPMRQLLQTEKPSIVVIYLGINDVWHGDQGTTKADFEAGLRQMIAMGKEINATIVLCTPSVIGEEITNNDLNRKLGEYADVVRQLAAAEKLVLCDIHKAFLNRLEIVNQANQHQGNLTYDGVHMNDQGNELLADIISSAIVEAAGAR